MGQRLRTTPLPESGDSTPPNLRSVLKTAHWLIEEGWCRGGYTRTHAGRLTGEQDPKATEHSLLSALGVALVIWKNESDNPAWLDLEEPLRLLVATAITRKGKLGFPLSQQPTPAVLVALWNDLPAMTKEEVLALLEEVIAEL